MAVYGDKEDNIPVADVVSSQGKKKSNNVSSLFKRNKHDLKVSAFPAVSLSLSFSPPFLFFSFPGNVRRVSSSFLYTELPLP